MVDHGHMAQRRAFGGIERHGRRSTLRCWRVESIPIRAGRCCRIYNDKLLSVPVGAAPTALTVSKAELGVIRDIRVAIHLKFGVGAQAARNLVGRDLPLLITATGGGGMKIVRLKLE